MAEYEGDGAGAGEPPLRVARTVRDGDWDDPGTWEDGRVPDGTEDWVAVAHRVAGRPAGDAEVADDRIGHRDRARVVTG